MPRCTLVGVPDDVPVPAGWPAEVLPPQAPEWEQTALAWLFDLCPPEYREYEPLRKHPVLLARFAREHVDAGVAAAREGWRTARRDLRGVVSPEVLESALAVYDREGRRLVRLEKSVALVEAALAGGRGNRPRLRSP